MLEKLNPFAGASTVSEIVDLRIYPIKSCRGISVQKSLLTRRGLDLDRRWMFVDAQTLKFITIRDISQLTLIDTSFDKDENLIISIKNTNSKVSVPARPTQTWLEQNTAISSVNIWENDTDGYLYSDSINDVFTEFFNKKVKLAYKGPTPRILRGNGAPDVLGREESTNFPDVLPLEIANEASIRELNSRLKKKGHDEITIERFRPNIVVRGLDTSKPADKAPAAWSEDDWKTVRFVNSESNGILGPSTQGIDIDVQARCARCQVPNVDPETADKDVHEPWDTLVSYRRIDEDIKWKPCFGMLAVPRNEGAVEVGMKFEVKETTQDHKYIKGF